MFTALFGLGKQQLVFLDEATKDGVARIRRNARRFATRG
jgi:hypothetical protein